MTPQGLCFHSVDQRSNHCILLLGGIKFVCFGFKWVPFPAGRPRKGDVLFWAKDVALCRGPEPEDPPDQLLAAHLIQLFPDVHNVHIVVHGKLFRVCRAAVQHDHNARLPPGQTLGLPVQRPFVAVYQQDRHAIPLFPHSSHTV